MKKHYGLMLILVALISVSWTVCSQAMELVPVTSFDSTWKTGTFGTATGTVTTDGSKVKLSAQGSATDYIHKSFYKTGNTGVVGMLATIRVDQANNDSTGYCDIGLATAIGRIGNSQIELWIMLTQANNNNNNIIRFSANAYDVTTHTSRTLARGEFGANIGAWTHGDSKTVAIARVGSEYWFYVSGNPSLTPSLIKVQAIDGLIPFDETWPEMFIYADKGVGNSISGTVSDIYLIKE